MSIFIRITIINTWFGSPLTKHHFSFFNLLILQSLSYFFHWPSQKCLKLYFSHSDRHSTHRQRSMGRHISKSLPYLNLLKIFQKTFNLQKYEFFNCTLYPASNLQSFKTLLIFKWTSAFFKSIDLQTNIFCFFLIRFFCLLQIFKAMDLQTETKMFCLLIIVKTIYLLNRVFLLQIFCLIKSSDL